VRKPEDVHDLRKRLQAKNSPTKSSRKSRSRALIHLREIILASDAVMVARGDLGVELPLERVPMIQKNIVSKCIHRAKPVIIATQMMESMMDRPPAQPKRGNGREQRCAGRRRRGDAFGRNSHGSTPNL
jgi:pyruvate kinase